MRPTQNFGPASTPFLSTPPSLMELRNVIIRSLAVSSHVACPTPVSVKLDADGACDTP
jgi:hypothetical protein